MFGFCESILKSIRGLAVRALAPIGILSYMAVRDRGCYDVLMCDHIGDFLYTAGYLRAFKRTNRIRRLRVVGTARLESLARFYPGVIDEYRVVGKRRLQLILSAYRTWIGRQYYMAAPVSVIEPSRDFVRQFAYVETFPNLTLRGCIQHGILRLSEEAQPELPQLCQAAPGHGETKRILLCPSAAVTEWRPYQGLFRQLCGIFSQRGLEVSVNDETVPLDECARRMRRADCVIGMRSGLLDLAALAGAPAIALYPPDSRLMRYFDLRRMNEHNPRTAQYRLRGSATEDIRGILAILRAFEEKTDGDQVYRCTGGRERLAAGTADL